jgi:hypothetical protein
MLCGYASVVDEGKASNENCCTNLSAATFVHHPLLAAIITEASETNSQFCSLLPSFKARHRTRVAVPICSLPPSFIIRCQQ